MLEQLLAAIPLPVIKALKAIGRFLRYWWADLLCLYFSLFWFFLPMPETNANYFLRMILPIPVGLLVLLVCHLPFLRRLHRGWRFIGLRSGACMAKKLYVDESCFPTEFETFAMAAPCEFRPEIALKADSSALLLTTAASLTLPMHPDEFQSDLHARLAAIGMQPERLAKRWKQLNVVQLAGYDAVVVRDGTKERFFLAAPAEEFLRHATHIWDNAEKPMDDACRQSVLHRLHEQADVSQPPITTGYFTGEWTTEGPAGLTYLGAIQFRRKPCPALAECMSISNVEYTTSLSGAAPDPNALYISAHPLDGHPCQMICGSGDPFAFMDVLSTLREAYRHRRRSLILLAFFLAGPYTLALMHPVNAALSFLPVALLALILRFSCWQLPFPRMNWKTILWLLVHSLLPFVLALPGMSLNLFLLAVYVYAVTSVAGLTLVILLRQPRQRVPYIALTSLATIVLLLCGGIFVFPIAAAFGSVLGLLWLLPWCVVKFE